MKRLIALVTGALVATGLSMTPAPAAMADTTITGDDWSMSLQIPDTSWSELFTTNFLTCQDLRMELTVGAPAGRAWSLAGSITGAGSAVSLSDFSIIGVGPQAGPVLVKGVSMCKHFRGLVAPPNNEYVAAGVATVMDSPTPSLPFEVRFRISPMQCSIQYSAHQLTNGVSAFPGQVVEYSRDGFTRPAPGGTVTLDRLEVSTWLKEAETTAAADGKFVLLAGRVLATGSYVRFHYSGDYWCTSPPAMPVPVWAPYVPIPMPSPSVPLAPPVVATPALPVPTVKIKAVSGRSKLKVDVNPNRGSKFYVFQVQRKNPDGSWKAIKSYETRGAKETRTLNLRKGTYRVWVRPGYGFAEAYSPNEVTLKR
jgi:hypothetical protein